MGKVDQIRIGNHKYSMNGNHLLENTIEGMCRKSPCGEETLISVTKLCETPVINLFVVFCTAVKRCSGIKTFVLHIEQTYFSCERYCVMCPRCISKRRQTLDMF